MECPVCIESIKSAPIHQCTNGHLVCKDCITKLDNCPICRSDSRVARNFTFEQIIGNFSAVELVNEGPFETPSEKPELQKWGHGFVSASFSNNGPIEEPSVQINIPQNSESVEHGGSYNQIISIFKGFKKEVAYLFCNPLCIPLLILLAFILSIYAGVTIGYGAKLLGLYLKGLILGNWMSLLFWVKLSSVIILAIFCYNKSLKLLAEVGWDIPEEYFFENWNK